MKYPNFKRYKFKFSTIIKNIYFKIYKFVTFYKHIDLKKYGFSKIYKSFDFRPRKFSFDFRPYKSYFDSRLRKFSFDFRSYKSYFDFRPYKFSRVVKYLDPRKYNFSKINRIFSIKISKYFLTYLAGAILLSAFIYLAIPWFFKYEKSKFENLVCKGFDFECIIDGKINYSFFPSPRIKFNNFIIKDLTQKKNILAQAENVVIKISLFNLYNKEKFSYRSIYLNKTEINLNLEKLNDYKKFYYEKFNFKPIKLRKGKINIFEKEKYITNIENIKFSHKFNNDIAKSVLKGKFLNDELYVKFSDKKTEKNIIAKLLKAKLLANVDIFNKISKTEPVKGNFLLKKNKNRIDSTFEYENSQFIFKKASLQNFFLEGKFDGKVVFFPYFNFDLNVDLNGLNFSKFHNFLVSLDNERKKKLFKINKKINGQLNLSANKIYSKYDLIESFESRIKFMNGNISIEQLLFNLGKLGAADLLGHVKSEGEFINFKFENNIFIDNQKYFFRKFGIYNRNNVSSNLFISGNVDLVNLNLNLYEISDSENKKFNQENTNYIEKEFNDSLFKDGYASFFNFLKLKEYIKLIMSDTD